RARLAAPPLRAPVRRTRRAVAGCRRRLAERVGRPAGGVRHHPHPHRRAAAGLPRRAAGPHRPAPRARRRRPRRARRAPQHHRNPRRADAPRGRCRVNLEPAQAERRFVLLTTTRGLPVGLTLGLTVLVPLERGLTLAEIGALLAAAGLVSLALELPTGGIADTIGRRPLLLA